RRDAVPDRVPYRRAPTGVGRGDSRSPAADAPRPAPRSRASGAGHGRAAAALVGWSDSAHRRPSIRPAVGCARRGWAGASGGAGVRIAIISPVWFAVPPTGYGGIEWVVSLLADGLVEDGHDVTLFASGDSRTKAELVWVYEHAISHLIGRTLPELNHALACYERASEFDVIND